MDDDLDPDKIYEAAQILDLNEKATMEEIKDSYRYLIKNGIQTNVKMIQKYAKPKQRKLLMLSDHP